MSKDIFSRYLITVALVALVLASSVYADQVEVTDPQSSTGEIFVVGVIEEDGMFWHDRVYLMQEVPEEYLGLTSIMTSADSRSDLDVQWTFEIDRPAFVYIAFDERWPPPEERDQDPKDWFNDAFTKTGERVLLVDPGGAAWAPLDYWIYKSNKPYPAGEVTLHGISEDSNGAVYRVTFLRDAKELVVSPQKKLAARWGEIKSIK